MTQTTQSLGVSPSEGSGTSAAGTSETRLGDLPGDRGIRMWMQRDQELLDQAPAPGTLEERRAAATARANTLAAEFSLPVAPSIEVTDLTLEALPSRPVLRRYRPHGASGPMPTQVFLHGGGFVFGSPSELVNDSLLSNRAAQTGLQIMSLEYPLAPEHPFPAARDRVLEVLEALAANADAWDIDAERLGLGGNSAGATIAASATLEAARRGRRLPHHLALEVPAVSRDVAGANPADHPDLLAARDAYDPHGAAGAFIADASVEELAGFPATLIVMAEHDPLRAGGEVLATKLHDVGAPVFAQVMPGHVHGSPAVTALSVLAMDWQSAVTVALCAAYDSTSAGGSPRGLQDLPAAETSPERP